MVPSSGLGVLEGSASGQFNAPFGVGIDSSGNVYVADSGNNRIQKFKNSGTFIRTFGTFGTLAQMQASSINPFVIVRLILFKYLATTLACLPC